MDTFVCAHHTDYRHLLVELLPRTIKSMVLAPGRTNLQWVAPFINMTVSVALHILTLSQVTTLALGDRCMLALDDLGAALPEPPYGVPGAKANE